MRVTSTVMPSSAIEVGVKRYGRVCALGRGVTDLTKHAVGTFTPSASLTPSVVFVTFTLQKWEDDRMTVFFYNAWRNICLARDAWLRLRALSRHAAA